MEPPVFYSMLDVGRGSTFRPIDGQSSRPALLAPCMATNPIHKGFTLVT